MLFFFFFQAEDGIRDVAVTGVQTCALPISGDRTPRWRARHCSGDHRSGTRSRYWRAARNCRTSQTGCPDRSEEHTSELQSRLHLVCRLLLEKKKKKMDHRHVSATSIVSAAP